MENLDIFILTSIVSTLFLVFVIVIYRELNSVEQKQIGEDKSPRTLMVKFVGSLFDEKAAEKLTPKQRALMMKAVKRTISDMETDGVYFPEEVKKELETKRKEMTCQYSGLPSIISYLDQTGNREDHA